MPLIMHQEKQSDQQIKHVIAVAAGKGGVGKSTITVHLARALVRCGYQVGILDADIYGPSIRKMVREDTLPFQEGNELFPAMSDGIKIMSMAFFRKEQEAAAFRAPIVSSLITQFMKDVSWGNLDYLLIDFPPGTGDCHLTICQQAMITGAIMVTTPQEVALQDVRKAMDLFAKMHVPLLGICENMSYYLDKSKNEKCYLFGKKGGARLASEAALPLLIEVPILESISACGDMGCSLSAVADVSEVVDLFKNFAKEVVVRTNCIASSAIHHFSLVDPYTLRIVWKDGFQKKIGVADVQKLCPCAKCQTTKELKEDVAAVRVDSVGRYAIKIQFTSGCSRGLYSYELLNSIQ